MVDEGGPCFQEFDTPFPVSRPPKTGEVITDGTSEYVVLDKPGWCVSLHPIGYLFQVPESGFYRIVGTSGSVIEKWPARFEPVVDMFELALPGVLEEEGVSSHYLRLFLTKQIVKLLKRLGFNL